MARTTPNLGLTVWNLGNDFFSHGALAADWDALDAHDHSPGKGALVPTAGLANLAVTTPKLADSSVTTIKLADANVTTAKLADQNVTTAKIADANVTTPKIADANVTAAKFGDTAFAAVDRSTPGGTTRRGKKITATSESVSGTTYQLLATPDQVSSVVLPTDGLIFVAYAATWQASVASAASAAIFLGSTQTQIGHGAGGTSARSATIGSVTAKDTQLYTTASGLVSSEQSSPGGFTNVTSGQILGADVTPASASSDTYGGCAATIFASAGTYDVSIRFRTSSGSVTVKDRRLWVWTESF